MWDIQKRRKIKLHNTSKELNLLEVKNGKFFMWKVIIQNQLQ